MFDKVSKYLLGLIRLLELFTNNSYGSFRSDSKNGKTFAKTRKKYLRQHTDTHRQIHTHVHRHINTQTHKNKRPFFLTRNKKASQNCNKSSWLPELTRNNNTQMGYFAHVDASLLDIKNTLSTYKQTNNKHTFVLICISTFNST